VNKIISPWIQIDSEKINRERYDGNNTYTWWIDSDVLKKEVEIKTDSDIKQSYIINPIKYDFNLKLIGDDSSTILDYIFVDEFVRLKPMDIPDDSIDGKITWDVLHSVKSDYNSKNFLDLYHTIWYYEEIRKYKYRLLIMDERI
jgi:hypothetical protein